MKAKRVRIEIKSDFHNTEAIVYAKLNPNGTASITLRSWDRASKQLCGLSGCICGKKVVGWGIIGYTESGLTFERN